MKILDYLSYIFLVWLGKYTRRIRLKEFFAEDDLSNNTQKEQDSFSELPFFNRKQSSFTALSGRGVYVDFFIEAISQELLQAEFKIIKHSNISKKGKRKIQGVPQSQM